MLRDNLVGLIVPMRSCGTQALGDEFSYLENPRPVGTESSLTGRCSSPFQTEPRQIKNTQLAPSENRSTTSADGRVATEAAWLNGKEMEEITERAEKTLDRDRPSHGSGGGGSTETGGTAASAVGKWRGLRTAAQ